MRRFAHPVALRGEVLRQIKTSPNVFPASFTIMDLTFCPLTVITISSESKNTAGPGRPGRPREPFGPISPRAPFFPFTVKTNIK